MKKRVKKWVALGVAGFIMVNGVPKIAMKKLYNYSCHKNSKTYEMVIDKYDNYVQEYANYINSLGLTDLEIIMKVMKDSWGNIQGYGKPDELVTGYFRLAFQEEGKGVCSSFADDFTAKINAINPKFNAENLYVYLHNDDYDQVNRVNIERNILDSSTPEVTEESKKAKKYGNHLVTKIEIPEQNLTLIVDSTNLLIGVMKNGKISILNSTNKDIMENKFHANLIFSEESLTKDVGEYFQTFGNSTLTNEEIENMYGFYSQNEAYEKINQLEELPLSLRKTF